MPTMEATIFNDNELFELALAEARPQAVSPYAPIQNADEGLQPIPVFMAAKILGMNRNRVLASRHTGTLSRVPTLTMVMQGPHFYTTIAEVRRVRDAIKHWHETFISSADFSAACGLSASAQPIRKNTTLRKMLDSGRYMGIKPPTPYQFSYHETHWFWHREDVMLFRRYLAARFTNALGRDEATGWNPQTSRWEPLYPMPLTDWDAKTATPETLSAVRAAQDRRTQRRAERVSRSDRTPLPAAAQTA